MLKLASAKVHFIGIGGIGMSGLAELLHNMGARVSGSDLAENAQTERLREMGIEIHMGHHAAHIGEPDVVVYSSAVKEINPEYKEARRLHIPLIPRAEALAEIMRLKRGIAVGGSHGKTTTTSLVASVFLKANMKPTIVVGGRLDLIKSTALLGSGDWLIAEADESDGSFTRLNPEIAIVTNIDTDHLDHFGNFANLEREFLSFASRIPFYGAAIVCGDNPRTFDLFGGFSKKIHFYGFHERNDFRLKRQDEGYSVWRGSNHLGDFRLHIPGEHNALNALAAMIAAFEAGIGFHMGCLAVSEFRGVDRRFQTKGFYNGCEIVDDYGHHPTEIRAVLKAAREKFTDKNLVVVFQPHRYSRTKLVWNEFLSCFNEADELYLLDIYPAGELPIEGISSTRLVEELDSVKAVYCPNREALLSRLREELGSGSVLITLGAGDVYKMADQMVQVKAAP